ncbi:MAG: agmatine deiminase family protein [Campylobacterota bacterium]|nr:agmatine deiminase family protein [Campylobacterota bacterium]
MKRLIAEFQEQSFTQIIFPHAKTDWADYLDIAEKTFINIIDSIIKYQKCLVVCDDIARVKSHFKEDENLFFIEYETNDTWARDSSALCVEKKREIKLLDFSFNGWGGKFEATKDNAMSKAISKHYSKELRHVDFILEGGAVESNGEGIILTTSRCQLNKNRNPKLDPIEITQKLNETLGATKVLYLEHGYLAGDDTDSHIDTLARFIDEKTIMYVACEDEKDEHYKELKLMKKELEEFAKTYNFRLIALPMTDAIYYKDERLPATYANFLFVNNAVLVPTYGVKQDTKALKIFRQSFKDRDIVAVDCSTLIRQHGSLHCVTMNFASGIAILV